MDDEGVEVLLELLHVDGGRDVGDDHHTWVAFVQSILLLDFLGEVGVLVNLGVAHPLLPVLLVVCLRVLDLLLLLFPLLDLLLYARLFHEFLGLFRVLLSHRLLLGFLRHLLARTFLLLFSILSFLALVLRFVMLFFHIRLRWSLI